MYLMNAAAAAAAAGGAHHVLLRHQQQQQQLRQRLDARDGECVMIMAGNGGVKVCEFVDMFCTHPPKPGQSGRNQQNFTTPNT